MPDSIGSDPLEGIGLATAKVWTNCVNRTLTTLLFSLSYGMMQANPGIYIRYYLIIKIRKDGNGQKQTSQLCFKITQY